MLFPGFDAARVDLLRLVVGTFQLAPTSSLFLTAIDREVAAGGLRGFAQELGQTDWFQREFSVSLPIEFSEQLARRLLNLDPDYDFEGQNVPIDFRVARDWILSRTTSESPGVVALDAVAALVKTNVAGLHDAAIRLQQQTQVAQYLLYRYQGDGLSESDMRALVSNVSASPTSLAEALSVIDARLYQSGLDRGSPPPRFIGQLDQAIAIPTNGAYEVPVYLQSGIPYAVTVEALAGSGLIPGIPEIRGPSGQVLPGSSTNAPVSGRVSLVWVPPEVGEYTIRVEGRAASTGQAVVSLRQIEGALWHSTSEFADANAIVRGTINSPFVSHTYAVRLTSGLDASVSVTGATDSANPLRRPKILEVTDPEGGSVVPLSDMASAFDPATLKFRPSQDGVYKVVIGDSYNDIGAFNLGIYQTGNSNAVIRRPDDPGDAVGSAASGIKVEFPAAIHELTNGIGNGARSLASAIDGPGDVDFVPITYAAGTRTTYDVRGASSGSGTLGDPVILGFADEGGHIVASTWNDDGGQGRDARLVHDAQVAGRGYLVIGGFADTTGTYLVEASETPLTASIPPVSSVSGNSWTVMIYMAADNDLESYAMDDLNEMEAADLLANRSIAVLVDRAPGYDRRDGDWTDTRIGSIVSDKDPARIATPLNPVGERDTGDRSTLADFIDWAAQQHPADRYALIVWNHGAGLDGVAFDNSSGNSSLSPADVAIAIGQSRLGRMDLVGFDTCSMGMLEQAHVLRQVADVMVASQGLEPAAGWNYTDVLSSTSWRPGAASIDLGQNLVASFMRSYPDEPEVALSAIHLDRVDEVANALGEFAEFAVSGTRTDRSAIRQAYGKLPYFEDNDSVDLGGLASAVLAVPGISKEFGNAATKLREAVEHSVIAHAGTLSGSSGLSIFWPSREPAGFDSLYNEQATELTGGPGWARFLTDYWTHLF